MANLLKRIVEGKSAPQIITDLWVDTNMNPPVLKTYQNGEWVVIAGTSAPDDDDDDSGGAIDYSEYLAFLITARRLIENTPGFIWEDYVYPISDYDDQWDDEYTVNIGDKDTAEYVIEYYLSDSNYGNIFVTEDEKDYLENIVTLPEESNYNYVDLGLPSGTLWAEGNIGYINSNDRGYHFLYGIENPINIYHADNTTFVQFDDDVLYNREAIAPTRAQLEELLANTTMAVWNNGVMDGVTLTGTNGNSIFIPFSGYYNTTSSNNIQGVGTDLKLWTRDIENGYPVACVIQKDAGFGEFGYSFEAQYYDNGCNVRSCKAPAVNEQVSQ